MAPAWRNYHLPCSHSHHHAALSPASQLRLESHIPIPLEMTPKPGPVEASQAQMCKPGLLVCGLEVGVHRPGRSRKVTSVVLPCLVQGQPGVGALSPVSSHLSFSGTDATLSWGEEPQSQHSAAPSGARLIGTASPKGQGWHSGPDSQVKQRRPQAGPG